MSSDTYTQSVKVNTGTGKTSATWTFTWTYSVAPTTNPVAPRTAWTSTTTTNGIDIGFSGFITSESFMSQSNRKKYSFTMTENGVTRARNVFASLMKAGNPDPVAVLNLNNLDLDIADPAMDALAVTAATGDFWYQANTGPGFGNLAQFGALHTGLAGQKPGKLVSNILKGTLDAPNPDNFPNNDNDIAAGNVQGAGYGPTAFAGITDPGSYSIVVTGVLKGNTATADQGFSVTSTTIENGGCQP